MILRLAALVGSLSLSACALPPVLTVIGSTLAGTKAVYDFAHDVTTDTSHAIELACRDWAAKKALAESKPDATAAKASAISPWADKACDPSRPPPGDPIAAAVWIAGLAGQVTR
jgi:hypothetical protein